jgi:MFS family permease
VRGVFSALSDDVGQRYRVYLLAVLTCILAFNYVDRWALGLLLQDIKADLGLSDTQLGLLTGIAFALFYSVVGLPIARWADRGNRIAIITITTSLWAAAVAACGLVTSFAQLLLIRIGVGVGESGCIPPAHSLIADHFTRAERPRASAIYMAGAPLSVVVGFFAAGWLNEFFGWRMTFMLLALPGLPLAALAWFTLKEPRKLAAPTPVAHASTTGLHTDPAPSVRTVFVTLWMNRTFRHLLVCFALASFFGQGIAQWKPAFFIRSYGLQSGELGTWLAAIYAGGGLLGTWLGGELASRLAARNERLQLGFLAWVYAAFAVISACIYLAPNAYMAFAFLALSIIAYNMSNGPLFATLQTLVPERMRALSIATIYLFANLIGLGLGPLAAGAMSDAFRTWAGEESLRYALVALSPGYFWAGWHLWRASRTVRCDLDERLTS